MSFFDPMQNCERVARDLPRRGYMAMVAGNFVTLVRAGYVKVDNVIYHGNTPSDLVADICRILDAFDVWYKVSGREIDLIFGDHGEVLSCPAS